MERAMNQAAIDAMAEAVLNPEFQAALEAFGKEPDAPADGAAAEAADAGGFDDPEFAALAQEVEAEAAVIDPGHPAARAGTAAAEMKISPFALLIGPGAAIAAAKHLESLPLPRRVVFLFGKKGVTSNPEISRLDQDMDLEADDDADEEAETAEW